MSEKSRTFKVRKQGREEKTGKVTQSSGSSSLPFKCQVIANETFRSRIPSLITHHDVQSGTIFLVL